MCLLLGFLVILKLFNSLIHVKLFHDSLRYTLKQSDSQNVLYGLKSKATKLHPPKQRKIITTTNK